MHFRTVSKLSRYFWMTLKYFSWFQNCLDISKLFQIFRTDTKLSEYFQMTKKSFRQFQNCLKTYRWPQTSSGKFPDNFKLFFHCFGDAQIFDFYLIMHFAALSWGAITRFFGFLRETLTHASSGKFLHVESCYPESFGFFCLWSQHTRIQFNKGNGIIICAKMEYLSYW